jgi:hypothetical protein
MFRDPGCWPRYVKPNRRSKEKGAAFKAIGAGFAGIC